MPTGFAVDTLAATGLQQPNDFCFLPDGRVLVANSAGDVSLYAGGALVTIGTVPNVESGGERGLLSIAADPAFASNGQIYVYYSHDADAFLHLDRFTCSGDLATAGSTNLSFAASTRRVILGTLPDNAFNHNGGSVRFGPDTRLYLTVGDDANDCLAQDVTSQCGCLLRLDVSTLPPGGDLVLPSFSSLDPGDNPLSANVDFSQLVLAHGLRNPFRMEIDQATGNLYIGDVGENLVEEYSEYVYNAGALTLANFGWPWREGDIASAGCAGPAPGGLVEPIATVSHAANWLALIGGARYRNQGGAFDLGPGYEGNAFFLDYYEGELRRLVYSGAWVPAPAAPGQPNATNWGTDFGGVTSLRQGPDGALWFTQRQSGQDTLKRIRPIAPNHGIMAVSGGGETVPAGEAFAAPLVARVLDAAGNPLSGAAVDFSIVGPGVLQTSNPVITDANGLAQTAVIAQNAGGAITVTGTTPGSTASALFELFSRKITATPVGSLLVLSIANATTAVPAQVPYVVMVSFPGSPFLPTTFGPLCTDPFYALTIVIEDGTGMFNFVSFSGTGGVGSPGLTKVYTLPPGLLSGLLMHFQAIGLDPVTGWFRTNCERQRF
ncbi:MAG TPA: PQQ-dependent sugar dehydrogenase [Planctomycetota bacterium]|nr:PQQ-dependent sugar dehydrogenase [Planctomycetota bacterium]